jgi:hypothetical protein
MNNTKLKKLFKTVVDNLIKEEWLPHLNREYLVEKKKYFHRECSEENLVQDIDVIFDKLLEIWTEVEIMEFTKACWEVCEGDIPGPQIEFHSILCILYQFTEGKSFNEMDKFIKTTTYKRIFETIFGGGPDDLHTTEKREFWADWSKRWFDRLSTEETRSIYAKINNPDQLKSVTCLIDGKNYVLHLQNVQRETRPTRNGKSNLISKKNIKCSNWLKAAKTVNLMTIEGYPMRNTVLVGANEKYDGHLAEKLNICQVLKKNDILLLDHHFDKFIRETFSNDNSNNELELNENNYLLKPRKTKKK